eukprot:10099065-Lingulodinium_polyedra.AAC.1
MPRVIRPCRRRRRGACRCLIATAVCAVASFPSCRRCWPSAVSSTSLSGVLRGRRLLALTGVPGLWLAGAGPRRSGADGRARL